MPFANARLAGYVLAAAALVWSCGDNGTPTTGAGAGAAGLSLAGQGSSGKGGQPSAAGGNTTLGGQPSAGGASTGGTAQAEAGAVALGGAGGQLSSGGSAGGGGQPSAAGASGFGGAPQAGASGAGGEAGSLAGAGGFDIGDLFGHQPGTIQRSGTITKNDWVCVVVFSGGMCLAQNDPPCIAGSPATTTTLSLTLNAQGQLAIQAPYQDMCTSDYVGAVVDMGGTPLGVAVATSYAVPLDTTAYYEPRSIDHCRVNASGTDTLVKDQIKTWIEGTTLFISQLCTTQFTVIDPISQNATPLTDTRSWTTKVELK